VSGRNVGVSQRNTVLNRNRRLLLCGHSKRKTLMMSTYNMTIANPAMAPGGGAWPDWPPGSATAPHCIKQNVGPYPSRATSAKFSVQYAGGVCDVCCDSPKVKDYNTSPLFYTDYTKNT